MIYIDASRYQNTAKRTGVENYSYFLINELVKKHPKEITLITPKKIDLPVEQIIIPFSRLWTQVRLSWELFKTKNIDNLFVPSHVLPLINNKKSVITIHDVAFKHSPKSYGQLSRWYLDWSTQFAVKHATKIIVPSEKTKADLIHFYHCPSSKIHVIPLGFECSSLKPSKKDTEELLKKHKLKEKGYFLYIGRIEWKKNSDNLIKAFELFSEKNPDYKLVMAGFPGHGGQEILNSIPEALKSRIILPGYISELEKEIFLTYALAFIFPSREEGFGIPLLEAMAANLPIIASNIPTSKEIAKDNALFFDPENPETLAMLMEKVCKTTDPKILKTADHQATLKHYSWEKCAEDVYAVLQ